MNSAKDKFVYITAIDISIDNGAGINEREFVKELLRNHSDKVLCILPYPANPENYFNEKIEYVLNHRRHNLLYWLAFVASLCRRVLGLRKKYKLRALVFRLDIIPLAELMLSFLGIPVILKTLAGGTFKARKIVQTVKDIVAPMRNRVVRSASAADAVGVTSKRWVSETYGLPVGRIAVIPNAANVDFFTPGSQSESRKKIGLTDCRTIVGYVGALRKISCIEILIHAFAGIDDQSCLVVVGDGPERDGLEALAIELEISDRIKFIGSVPYGSVPDYIRAFDVAVDLTASPIKIRDKIIYASYSQKIPQYLACGIPVVAWDFAETKFLKDNQIGEIVEMKDKDKLFKSIKHLLQLNPAEKKELSYKARNFAVTQISFENVTRQRIAFWEQSV